jgi:hypothetical protein
MMDCDISFTDMVVPCEVIACVEIACVVMACDGL